MKGVIMMLTIYTSHRDRKLSDLIERYGGPRSRRYIDNRPTQEASQCRVFKEFFDHFVKGKDCSPNVRKYIIDSAKQAKESLDYQRGLIGWYDNQYVVVFLNCEGLDTCGIKITHNEKEKETFRAFMSGSSSSALNAFYVLCLRLLREKQRARMFHELPTAGVIYSNYPEEDFVVSDGFIQYINTIHALEKACFSSVRIISDALDRGVTYDEINSIFPNDIEARFLNRNFNGYEKAQLESITHNCAIEA